MALMVGEAEVVVEAAIEPKGDPPDSVVESPVAWEEAAVHRIMGNDEQACVQKGATQQGDHDPDGREVFGFDQTSAKTEDPAGDDQSRQDDSGQVRGSWPTR